MLETFNKLIHRLMQELPDQSIAYEVLIRKPRTLSEAVDMITWHECGKETPRKKSGIKQLSTFDDSDKTAVSREDLHTLEVRGVNGKRFVTEERLIQFGRELKTSIEKLLRDDRSNQKGQGNQPNQAEEAMPRRGNFKNVTCYYCNEPGHIYSRCPVKAAQVELPKKRSLSRKSRKTMFG